MNADEIFKKLGYEINTIIRSNLDKRYIVYSKNDYLIIEFDSKHKTVETYLNDNEHTVFELEMNELKAINKKCEELGWYD